MLCTVANVKDLLGLTETDVGRDAVIGRLCAGVSAQMARAAGRLLNRQPCLEYAAGRVEYQSIGLPRAETIWLAAYPVIGDLTEIKEAMFGAHDDADALTRNADYQLEPAMGAVHRIGYWLAGVRTVKATYAGGFTPAEAWVSEASYTTGDAATYGGVVYTAKTTHTGVATVPSADTTNWLATEQVPVDDDIRGKAAKQAGFYFQRRAQLGLIGAGTAGGSYSTYAKDDLLPDVRKAAQALRRGMG